jgi:hypothetical protein
VSGELVEDWFLSPAERGNPDTEIDSIASSGRSWTEGNLVQPLVDGVPYFRRLRSELEALERGDSVWFTEWRGDRDELLSPDGPTVGGLLAALAGRGIDVRGPLWRSHPHGEAANRRPQAALAVSGSVAAGARWPSSSPPIGLRTRAAVNSATTGLSWARCSQSTLQSKQLAHRPRGHGGPPRKRGCAARHRPWSVGAAGCTGDPQDVPEVRWGDRRLRVRLGTVGCHGRLAAALHPPPRAGERREALPRVQGAARRRREDLEDPVHRWVVDGSLD